MTKEEAKKEICKVFEPAFANYIITALEEGATVSDGCEDAVSREFMYKLGATCIATRDKNDKLIALGTIENLPSVRPMQRKGKWITKYHGFPQEPTTVCSECGFDRDFNIRARGFSKIKYCPGCGRRMI